MAGIMKIDDEVRIKVLEALLQKGAVIPNIRQIKRHTGLHKATIKSSLDFLVKQNILNGFGPKINFREFGYRLEPLELLQIDLSQKTLFEKFLNEAKKDPHIYRISAIIGAGNWNVAIRHFYSDIESFHKHTQKAYYEKIPRIYDLIKDRQIFYGTEPFYKVESRTKSIIEIIKHKKGF